MKKVLIGVIIICLLGVITYIVTATPKYEEISDGVYKWEAPKDRSCPTYAKEMQTGYAK
jgi:hypothetical protein